MPRRHHNDGAALFFGLIIKTKVAYLPLKRLLFYPVFFYNICNVIIFNIFRQVRHNGFRCFNCKNLSKYRNFFTVLTP